MTSIWDPVRGTRTPAGPRCHPIPPLKRVMKPERVQVGQKRRRGGSGLRRPAAGATKATLSDHKGARQAETRPDLEGPGPRPGAGHLRSIRATKEPSHAADLEGSRAVMRRLMQETFIRCQPQVAAALKRCFTNPKTVLDCMRLLARLNGELP